jgi:prevent-host-death family protein
MKMIEMTEAKGTLAEYVRRMAQDAVIVAENGRPVAALVAIENADLETISLSTNPEFLAIIERSRSHQEKEGGISSKEMRRRLGLSKQKGGKSTHDS